MPGQDLSICVSCPFYGHAKLLILSEADVQYGRSQIGAGAHVNVEFVSANPTGPLHAAHARGAVIGDALAGLMEFCGWDVTREYYINDAGGQVDVLARSAYLRYCEALGQDIGDIPSGLYPGDYLKDVGKALAKEVGARYLDRPEAEWLDDLRQFSIQSIMDVIKQDLIALGINMDVFSSERSLVESGAVQHAIDQLQAAGHLYKASWHRRKAKSQKIGSRVNSYCSKRLNLVTIQIGLYKNLMVAGPILPLMLPII